MMTQWHVARPPRDGSASYWIIGDPYGTTYYLESIESSLKYITAQYLQGICVIRTTLTA